MMVRSGVLACVTALLVAGCTALPTSGPTVGELESARTSSAGHLYQSPTGLPIAFVDVNADVARTAFRATGSATFSGMFTDRRPAPTVLVGPGDTLQVTIFEASAGGLFSPPTNSFSMSGGNLVNIPAQTIGRDGMITVPYAGQIRAAGRTVAAIQGEAVERLRSRAIEPQVVISLAQSKSNLVTVGGEVNAPTRMPVNPNGDRILDALASAGGTKFPAHETFVTLQRGNKRATVAMTKLVSEPRENIYVRGGDTLIAIRQQRHYLAFGATGRNGQFPFELDTLSVAEGVAKAGGLMDERADPAMVYLYRQENRSLVERLGVSTAGYHGNSIPVLYRFDLREPSGFILAKTFPMIDKDVIYIANASSTDFMKAVSVIRGATGIARDVDALRRGATIIN